MKRRRRSDPRFHEPSLVPFADTVNATVGFKLFVLILTVLATGGAVVPKSLPIERKTDARPLFILCAHDRLLPVDMSLSRRFEDAMQRPKSFADIDRWLGAFRQHREEDELFVARGEGSASYHDLGASRRASLRLSVKYAPKPNAGDTSEDIRAARGRFVQVLAQHRPTEYFTYFIVEPGCIDLFNDARAVARARHFVTGWTPHKTGDSIGFSLTGEGRNPIPQ